MPIHKLINWLIVEDKKNKCYNQVTSKGAVFYESSEVDNLQQDRSKIVIGNNTHIKGTLLTFSYGGSITLGENCFLGKSSNIWSANRIQIGNNVLISHNVNIVDTDSHEIDYLERSVSYHEMITKGHPKTAGNVKSDPVVISDNVWVSFNAVILKGVTIGEGAIIAAGSVVTKNVEPFTLVAGNPAKFVKYLNASNNSEN